MATVFAEWDGHRRGLRDTPATIQDLTSAVRTAYGWSTEPLLKFSWLDEDNDAIQMSADSELAEAIEIASKSGTPLVVQVSASGDLSMVHATEGDARPQNPAPQPAMQPVFRGFFSPRVAPPAAPHSRMAPASAGLGQFGASFLAWRERRLRADTDELGAADEEQKLVNAIEVEEHPDYIPNGWAAHDDRMPAEATGAERTLDGEKGRDNEAGRLVIHSARYGWAWDIWNVECGSGHNHAGGAKDVTDIVKRHVVGDELHINPDRAPQYMNQIFWPETAPGPGIPRKLAVRYSYGIDGPVKTVETPAFPNETVDLHVTEDTASAPAFPTLPEAAEDALPESALQAEAAVDPSDLDLCFGDPSKCGDCKEFYASEGGRCSVCARAANSETCTAPPSVADEDTPADYDDRMVMVGAAIVGASVGALAGGLAAVVGAGAGAWAATRPEGDKVGDSARFAGRKVVQVGTMAQEKVPEAANMFATTAERIAATAAQKTTEAKLSERAANARSRLEDTASSLNRRAREVDAEYQVSEQLQKVSERMHDRAKRVVSAVAASSLVRWASDQVAGNMRASGGEEPVEDEDQHDDGTVASFAGVREEHC